MNRHDALTRSWDRNADNWTRVVRDRLIPSRRAGTDDAVLDAIAERAPKRLLDIGCGEGWLIRAAVARTGCAAVGIDGAAALIEAARAADPANGYFTLDYDSFAAGHPSQVGADFDVVAFNYSLFVEDIAPLLRAAVSRLAPGGVIVIQTLHPTGQGEDGWRTEDFAAFDGGDWAVMPWYSRSLDSWRTVLRDAGLAIRELREPAADGRVLSLLMICTPMLR
jgi:2-polyprenyl-3-methyl-5-hydroxy-6-metoxy-1,4-benzoquinol methylase